MTDNIRRQMEEEIKKSINDPIYFINNFIKIKHPVRGVTSLRLYPYQERLISEMIRNDHLIINKSRQMGCSATSAAFFLWHAMFHHSKNVLIINTKRYVNKEACERIKFMYNNLPSHFKSFNEMEDDIISSFNIKFNATSSSIIFADGLDESSWRAVGFSWVFVDEAAFIKDMKLIFDELFPISLLPERRLTMFSTPNGKVNQDGSENVFFDVYSKSKKGVGPFFAMDIPWYLNPEKNDEWIKRVNLFMNEKTFSREYNLSFE